MIRTSRSLRIGNQSPANTCKGGSLLIYLLLFHLISSWEDRLTSIRWSRYQDLEECISSSSWQGLQELWSSWKVDQNWESTFESTWNLPTVSREFFYLYLGSFSCAISSDVFGLLVPKCKRIYHSLGLVLLTKMTISTWQLSISLWRQLLPWDTVTSAEAQRQRRCSVYLSKLSES